MTDDYLWDGSGEPDPEVQRLERLLERFRQTSDAIATTDGTAAEAGPVAEAETGRGGKKDELSAREQGVVGHPPSRAKTVADGDAIGLPPPGAAVGGSDAESIPAASPAPLPWRRREGRTPVSRRRLVRFAGAIAAAIIIAVAGIGVLWRTGLGSGGGGWEVVALAGEPTLASQRLTTTGTLRTGEWIETDETSRAEIKIGLIGTARIEPRTRVRLLQAGTTQHRIGLARGTVHARIWAPPRLFFVETPSAVAIDLGCAYTLTVDDDGGSLLRVESGWVAFEDAGAESFVPAGALCRTRPGQPPGTPYFEDAAPEFVTALSAIDAPSSGAVSGMCSGTGARVDRETGQVTGAGASAAATELTKLLDAARPRDALTLWHLLSRCPQEDRARLFDRMTQLVPPPSGVTRAGILAGDRRMVDLWWDELGLGVTSWWRLWKQPGPPRETPRSGHAASTL